MAGASKRRRTYAASSRKRMRAAIASRSNPLVSYAKFKRTSWSVNWPFNTTSTAGFYRTIAPTLDTLSNVAEYSSLFDTYKVHKVIITFIPRFGETALDATDSGPQVTYNNQFYMTVGLDRNNFTTPTGTYANTTFNDFLQRVDNVRTYKLDKPFSYSYKPNIRASVNGGTSVIPCPWISTTNTSEPLLGSMGFIHDVNFTNLATAPPSVDLMVTLEFTMRGNR